MVSINNMQQTYSEKICKLFEWKPSQIVFLIKKRKVGRCPILNSYPIKLTKAATPEVFIKKTAVLKNFATFTGKHLCCLQLYEKQTSRQVFSC